MTRPKVSYCHVSSGSSAGIATGYELDDRGAGVRGPEGCVSSRRTLGPIHPPVQWVPWDLSPGVKWQEREADHSPPTSA
jgi:hypothetical protein